jgi:hypothetical protein
MSNVREDVIFKSFSEIANNLRAGHRASVGAMSNELEELAKLQLTDKAKEQFLENLRDLPELLKQEGENGLYLATSMLFSRLQVSLTGYVSSRPLTTPRAARLSPSGEASPKVLNFTEATKRNAS